MAIRRMAGDGGGEVSPHSLSRPYIPILTLTRRCGSLRAQQRYRKKITNRTQRLRGAYLSSVLVSEAVGPQYDTRVSK